MRRDFSYLFPLISMLLLCSALSYGQAWSGVLASSRGIDWSKAGLPATLPDGETTPNPWTPPTRTQCGATLTPLGSGQNDEPQIATALSNCTAGNYVLLGTGTFTLSSNLFLSPGYSIPNGVTLRGSGPMSTTIDLSGSAFISIGAASGGGSGTVASGLSQSSTSVTLSGVTGSSDLQVNGLMQFTQCDSGFSGSGCETGSVADSGGIFVMQGQGCCDTEGGGNGPNTSSQTQTVLVTSVTNNGGGSYTVGFSPGLYMPNWSTSSNATATWDSHTYFAYGMGLEDMSIICAHCGGNLQFGVAYASWFKGVRWIGSNGAFPIGFNSMTKNSLVSNSYIYGETPTSFDSSGWTIGVNWGGTDNLLLNTITSGGLLAEAQGNMEGSVIAYNYNRDVESAGYQPTELQHNNSPAFLLFEGNQIDRMIDDNTWTSHNFDSFFRNYLPCWDTPYNSPSNSGGGIEIGSYARFENAIGNAIGDTTTVGQSKCNVYINSGGSYIFAFGGSGEPTQSSPINQPSAMLWGNCDSVNNTCRFVSAEVPTNLSTWPNSVPFENAVPSTHNLPPSFFMNNMMAHPNGGTGLSWWKVCTSWNAFPTSCNASQTQPFPTAGPDVSSGPYVNGNAYDIPASIAYQYLPVDGTFQNSYTIASSSWSGGSETLTISSSTPLPNTDHLMGGFQITGVPACNSPTGAEFLMTGSAVPSGGSGGTISYALATNPGSCAGGTVEWPDVRQFDERVYQTDPGGDPPNPPTGLTAVVQ